MAYVPPHKRHSISGDGQSSTTPTPDSLSPLFSRSLNLRSFSDNKKKNRDRNRNRGGLRIIYAPNSTPKWLPVGLASCFDYSDDDATQFLSLTELEPFSLESYERKFGAKPRVLVLNHDRVKEYGGDKRVLLENQWDFVAENLKQDLLSAIQRVKDEMKDDDCERVKPTLVARFGRVIFHGPVPTFSEGTLRQTKLSFHTNVSSSFVEHIVNEVIPKLRTDVELDKESYVVLLSDNVEPDSTISCKCTLGKDGKTLQLNKIQWNHVRHLVADMSCLGKSLDLRFMMYTRRTVKGLTDDEMKCINFVIGSAILDPEVKGGVRWPLGTDTSGDRYRVVRVWHLNSKSFKNSSIKLKVRHADRFDFGSSLGEVLREVSLHMYDIVSHFQEQPQQDDLFIETLKRDLKLIWDDYLSFP